MIVLEIATIGEIEFLEFATLSEIRDSFTVYKTQPVDRGRLWYQLALCPVRRGVTQGIRPYALCHKQSYYE